MQKFVLPTCDYHVMSQTGVSQYEYPRRYSHNAIWDSCVGPDGAFYYALASEISTANYVRFCRYDGKTGQVEELFRIEDVILPTDRSIRASKFHSSICFLNDGKICMTTHTTDKSPRHPTWLPLAHYHHQWDGFAGGHIVVYDPKTREAHSLGIPVPYETIYGATYDKKHHALYFLGMMRGRLYRYDFGEKTVRCLGKMSENNAFRLVVGPDDNIYGASRSGYLYRINVDTQTVTDLSFQLRHETYDHSCRYNNLSIARIGPDGRLYLAGMYARSFYALDCSTGKITEVGHYLPADRVSPDENRNGVFGMDFDSQGILWYAVTALNNYEENIEFGIPATLYRWDITRGGTPEYAGILGTPDFGGAWISEVAIHRETDRLYAANSNHSLDGPGLITIDLPRFAPARTEQGPPLLDGYFNPENREYQESGETIRREEAIMGENACQVPLPRQTPVLLWRGLAPQHIEDSAVKSLRYVDAQTLCGICGEKEKYLFSIQNGILNSIVPLEQADPVLAQAAQPEPLLPIPLGVTMPHLPGRQFKRQITGAAVMADGAIFAGTEDGMTAVIRGDTVFALGPCANNGPVHQVVATPDGRRIFGVAGDEDDIAVLFTYDHDTQRIPPGRRAFRL